MVSRIFSLVKNRASFPHLSSSQFCDRFSFLSPTLKIQLEGRNVRFLLQRSIRRCFHFLHIYTRAFITASLTPVSGRFLARSLKLDFLRQFREREKESVSRISEFPKQTSHRRRPSPDVVDETSACRSRRVEPRRHGAGVGRRRSAPLTAATPGKCHAGAWLRCVQVPRCVSSSLGYPPRGVSAAFHATRQLRTVVTDRSISLCR